jgi:hypothetical protein
MSSTPDLSTVNPDAALAARADERLVHAYEQIARADEQLARVTEQLSRLEQEDARRPAAVPALQPSRGRPALRGFIGFVLAACIGGAAVASKSSYGEATRLAIAPWVPDFVSTSWLTAAKPREAQPSASPVQLAAAETTLLQPAAAAQSPAQDVPPASASTSAPLSPELTQMLQTMAHDIANVAQGIEQLKANQAQMAADNARAIEQLRASQEQLTRLAARPADKSADKPAVKPSEKPKPAEQATRGKPPAAPPPKPVASAARKPPTQPSQARAPAQPVQLQPDDQ